MGSRYRYFSCGFRYKVIVWNGSIELIRLEMSVLERENEYPGGVSVVVGL